MMTYDDMDGVFIWEMGSLRHHMSAGCRLIFYFHISSRE